MSIQKPTTKTIGVRRIVKEFKSGAIDTNHKIQRRNVWKKDQKQGLIASILEGYDIPAIYAIEDENGNLSLLDGKQRLTSTVEFVNGAYPLGEEFSDLDEGFFAQFEEPITIEQIKGKYFYDLPKDIQNEIETFTFNFRIYKKLTDRQIKNLFYRLNRGTSLNNIELLRVEAEFMLEEIQLLENSNFFKNVINMTETAKNRFTDEEVIIQSLALLYYGSSGFSNKDMKGFVKEFEEFKTEGLTEYTETINEINFIVLEYFDKAFKEKVKELRKVHIPTLIKVAQEAIKLDIEPERFGIWTQQFLTENTGRSSNSKYKSYISGSTSKLETVKSRYEFMLNDFNANIGSILMPEFNNEDNNEGENVDNENIDVVGNEFEPSELTEDFSQEPDDNEQNNEVVACL